MPKPSKINRDGIHPESLRDLRKARTHDVCAVREAPSPGEPIEGEEQHECQRGLQIPPAVPKDVWEDLQPTDGSEPMMNLAFVEDEMHPIDQAISCLIVNSC